MEEVRESGSEKNLMNFCWPEEGGACGKDSGDLQELSGPWLPGSLSYNLKGLNSVNNKSELGSKVFPQSLQIGTQPG